MYKIDRLYSDLRDGINIERNLAAIREKIENETHPEVIRNLRIWKRKYEQRLKGLKLDKIMRTKVLNSKDPMLMSNKGKITEGLICRLIKANGLKFNDIEITEFESEKRIGTQNEGTIDLEGRAGEECYIIEVKTYSAKGQVIGQVLAYYQYFKNQGIDNLSIILIAPGYTRQYRLAAKAIEALNINIIPLVYHIVDSGLIFKVLDK